MDAQIRLTTPQDIEGIFELYYRAAAIPGGLARLQNEIDRAYVSRFVENALTNGVALVAEAADGRLVGELHASSSGLYCFSHVLSDLTVVVDSRYRQQGIARSLFEQLFNEIDKSLTHISRVELIARESNGHALTFYESLGFVKEGRLEQRIKNADGSLEADIPMAWRRD